MHCSSVRFSTLSLNANFNVTCLAYQSSGDRIYLVGGEDDYIMYYHIPTDSFTNVGPFPLNLDGSNINAQSSTQWGNYIIFANDGKLRGFDTVSHDMLTWSASMPDAREAPCVATDNTHIFVTGGMNGNDESRRFQIYDNSIANSGAGDPWTVGNSMIAGRSKHACAVHDDYLYVFGGAYYYSTLVVFSGAAEVASNERIYVGDIGNIGSYSWENIPYIPDHNVYFQRAVVDAVYNQIYLIGGRDGYAGAPSDTVQIYDTVKNEIEIASAVLNAGRSSPAAIFVGSDERIFVFYPNSPLICNQND